MHDSFPFAAVAKVVKIIYAFSSILGSYVFRLH